MDLASLAGFAPSGERDDDASQWTGRSRTDRFDYVDTAKSLSDLNYGVALVADAPAGATWLVVPNTPRSDEMFCSFDGSGLFPRHALCSDDDFLGNRCASAFDPESGRMRNAVLEVRDARGAGRPAYEMVGVLDYSGCGDDDTGTARLRLAGGLRRPARAGDTLQYYLSDAVHLSAWGARWEAQAVLTASYERDFTPNRNLLPNGAAERPCDSDPGWRHGDVGGAQVALGPIAAGRHHPSHAPAAASLARAFAGRGCGFENDASGGDDYVEVGPVRVERRGLYNVRCMIHGSGGAVVFELRDAEAGAPLPARRWSCRGECLEASGSVIAGTAASGWGLHLLQSSLPEDAEVSVRVRATNHGDTVLVDECAMSRAPVQRAGLNRVIPDGAWRFFCLGDSRANLRGEFCHALDTLIEASALRKIQLLPAQPDTTFENSSDTQNGRTARGVVRREPGVLDGIRNLTEHFDCASQAPPLDCQSVQEQEPARSFRGPRPAWLILKLGRNDIAQGRTPEQTRGDVETLCRDAMAAGTRCLVVGEPPSQGDTGVPRCNDGAGPGTGNCGVVFQRYSARNRRGDGAAVPPIGWQAPARE